MISSPENSSFSPARPASPAASLLTRRDALKRVALMLGAAITPSILAGALQAQTASAAADAVKAAPLHLTKAQFETAAALTERIIPRTDTPGARDVGVPAFIDLMVGGYMTPEEIALFTQGLADAEAASRQAHQRGFAQLSGAEQDRLLEQMATASQNKEKTFFYQLKELTLVGYFTSEQVGKHVLRYDPIPGRFEGCIPVSETGNVSWTSLR